MPEQCTLASPAACAAGAATVANKDAMLKASAVDFFMKNSIEMFVWRNCQ
jgi:hypothetical protein